MSDISTISTSLRYLIEDFLRTANPGDLFTYGSSSVFSLSEPNVSSVTAVLKNDVALSSGNYSYSSTTNKVTVTASLVAGDTVEVQYTFYSNFSDGELESYIRAASIYLSTYNYYTWEVDSADNFYPDVTDKEKNLVAVVSSILINKPISSLRLPDISLNFPENMSMTDKIAQTIKRFKQDNTGVFEIIKELS